MPLSQEHIITTAIELLADGGLDNVTFRKLAAILHVQAPALYWHLKNKRHLIDLMAESILSSQFKQLETCDSANWQEWLISLAQQLRQTMLKYPDGARVIAGAHLYPTVTLAKIIDTSLASLVQAGLSIEQSHRIVTTVIHFTFGRAIEEQDSPTLQEMQRFDFKQFFHQFPSLGASIQQQMQHPLSPENDFIQSLRRIIYGPAAD
jgi:TetR/AcrR family tetracycline transcriptional repressor